MIRPILAVAVVASALIGAQRAQAQNSCRILCPPVFVAQPGLIFTNVISKPEGTSTNTDFLLRFTTVMPTEWNRLALVALTQWTPGENGNQPAFVYGGVITLVPNTMTGGWLSVTFDPLGLYSPQAGTGEHAYTHKLDLEGTVGLSLAPMMPQGTWLSSLSISGLVDYIATGLGDNATAANRWVFLALVTVPLAPWPH